LNEYTILVPPLRGRREDIPYLAKRFLDIVNIELSKSIKGFSPSAIEAMLCYGWPGNVRQLRSAVRRAVLMAEDIVTAEHLGLKQRTREGLAEEETAPSSSTPGKEADVLSLREIVWRHTIHVERIAIVHALRRTGGNKAKAARLLQVDYKTLHSKVKEYGIQNEGETTT
jgi:two-component system nitrogen regulation response regulator GlnG